MFQLRHFIVICVLLSLYFVDAQVVNLAFKKLTSSTVHQNHVPSLAVDGNISKQGAICAHTIYQPKQTVAWWQVDLAVIAEIINITIYYRESKGSFKPVRRLNGFQITVGLDTNWHMKAPCYSDNDPGYPTDITTILTCRGPGQYVTIFNYHFDVLDTDFGPILELCEVQVFGCTPKKYGPECTFDCHCKQKGCFRSNGTCFMQGCEAGWEGLSCNKTCQTDHFGKDCKFTCHCLTGSCPPSTGICSDRKCKPGWLTKTCSQPCVNDTFGEGCNSTCHCNQSTCNNSNGQCLKKGCKPGWKGNSCFTQCPENTFGPDCKYTCHCLNGTCNRIHGTCTTPGCIPGYQSKTCSELYSDMNISSIPTIVGALSGGFGFILVTVLMITFIFRRRRNAKGKDDASTPQDKPDDVLEHVYHELKPTENTGTKYSVIQTESIKETSYVNIASNTTILKMGNIKDVVAEKIKNGTLLKEYKQIPSGPLYPQTAGNLNKNKKKNRNRNILPYDHSRVILDTSDQNQDADYINASYIYGLNEDLKYIATQGPMKYTVEDFWRMVWQTKSSIIVMLINVIQDKEVTCFQYWPDSSSVLACLDYEIIPLEEQRRSEFITRKLKVKNTKTGEIRKVWHLQFTSWPRQGNPIPYQLLLLHRKFAEIKSTNNSTPAVIHCSDGTDRTGIFIAFDAISQCCYRNEAIDICMFVTEMRKKRINMVAKEESYVLLHTLFLENLQFESTQIAKHELLTSILEDGNRKNREYKMLIDNLPVYDDTVYKEALLKKNRGKHRNQSILPVQTYRVILNKRGAADYINAVEIPSCRISNQFLVTQIPFVNTIVDLWKFILEYKSCTIVNLEDEPSFEKDLIWHPTDENKLVIGNLILTKTSESMTTPGTREIGLKVFDKETNNERFVKLFRYLNWRPESATPAPQTSFLDLIHLVLTWNKSINNGPITVICSDGAKCCGLFCLVYSVIENLSYSDDIDIFQIARLQQIRRPEFFSLEQYHFCYNIIEEYLEKVQLYSNIE